MASERKKFKWIFPVVLITVIVIVIVIVLIIIFCSKSDNKKTINTNTVAFFEKTTINDELKEEEQINYYDVSGNTKNELKEQMAKLGPECGKETRCHAYTNWSIDWTYPARNGNSCEPITVTVSAEYTLPRWIDKENAPSSLKTEWDAYLVKLQAHETHHKDIAVTYGQKMIEKIKAINNYGSCRELEDQISAAYASPEVVNACTLATQKYDDDTNHGATEGVIF